MEKKMGKIFEFDAKKNKKKALLVGVDDYAHPGGPDLRGCVNDVRDMAHTLNVLDIVPARPGNMRILTNGRATRQNILRGLEWLIDDAKPGDFLIFTFSGHGSQVADTDGDEIDHWDETLCPHDYYYQGMIIDDELQEIFRSCPKGVNLEVVLDCCHSGTGTREVIMNPEMTGHKDIAYRFIEPPIDFGYFLDAGPLIPRHGIMKDNGADRQAVISHMNHVLWAACRDDQSAAEVNIGGRVRGVFTYCFCRVLRRIGTRPDLLDRITRARIDSIICTDISGMGHRQVPQLEGTKHALHEPIFS